MFLPMTRPEMQKLGWERADVILVSGDAYIDSPFCGIAVVGKTLMTAGYKTVVISQPDTCTDDIMKLGTPNLYWGVSAGATDSLVANYTSSGKKRKNCDFTPGGVNCKRPDRASIVYSNLIKRYSPAGSAKKPIVLGGIEASLRRMAHYDFLEDKIRRPILFDAKADFLIYGQGEITAVRLAEALANNRSPLEIDGLCHISRRLPEDAMILPTFEECAADRDAFAEFFRQFHFQASTLSRKISTQKCGDRWLVQNPAYIMDSKTLDHIYGQDFERAVHPYDLDKGAVAAAETTRFSITSHRGCFGECNFCAISVHQGRMVVSRGEASIISEARTIAAMRGFNGTITDVGGATANMYGAECPKMLKGAPCADNNCLFPVPCEFLNNSQKRYADILAILRKTDGIKKINVASGIRCDLALADKANGGRFISDLAKYHTGGQIKLAPEHIDPAVLRYMGKCSAAFSEKFAAKFMETSRREGKKQFVTYYFMAAHPGCTVNSMEKLKRYIREQLNFTPEQVQIFTPTPSTWSTCMYYTEKDKNGEPLFVPKGKIKNAQKKLILR
jgi:uncharacterized radical SAM protein YgiQ